VRHEAHVGEFAMHAAISRTALAALAFCAFGVTACTAQQSASQGASQNAPASGGPVEQGPPNKRDAQPAFAGQTRAPESKSQFSAKTTVVAEGLSDPWGMAILPGGEMLVTERTGKMWRITQAGAKTEVTGTPEVDARGQGGLLDVSLSPDFATSRAVYFTFSEPRGDRTNGTSLARGVLSADGSKLENVSVIFRQEPAWASTLHYGSNIEWASNGDLFLTLGERSMPQPRELAQDLSTHLGKVLRLKADGTPAEGNPFAGRDGAQPEIWSYGHRNVQGAAIHPESGKLWTVEHGPRGGDEINIPEAGKNYGWPVIIYGIEYPGGAVGEGITSKDGMEQPVYYWDPVIAPGDMTFYTGDLFPWKGDLLVAGLASGVVVRLELDGERVVAEERLFSDIGARIRDVTQAPDGSLWLLTDESDGQLIHVTKG
jgi:glucose/arabinose dehydrogenase